MQNFGPMTPLMKQYWDIKSLHSDKILLFRMGDFYEMFFDDAKTAAPILGIALTQRNKKSQDETPMCGMPHHSVGGPINKLLAAGLKVAICDQLEDPKQAKGIVKRGITRVLTPGMVYDPDTLDPRKSYYIASFSEQSLALVDSTTGESLYFTDLTSAQLNRLMGSLPIVELVIPSSSDFKSDRTLVSKLDAETFEAFKASDFYTQMNLSELPTCCALVFAYIRSLESGGQDHLPLQKFENRKLNSRLELSPTVIRHLEIFETYRGEVNNSLMWATDRTKTSAGARLYRQWLQFPLTNKDAIEARFDQVEFWRTHPGQLKIFRDLLSEMGDVERRLARISHSLCNVRDLQSLSLSVQAATKALRLIHQQAELQRYEAIEKLATEILHVFVEDAPLLTTQGFLFKKDIYPELDELIELTTNSQGLLQQLEQREKDKTQISSLKVRYNNVFGYYIEVTHAHKDKVPAHYMRKQTLTNAERYTTDELNQLEQKVLSANHRRSELEKELFEDVRRRVLAQAQAYLGLSASIAEKDVLSSLAWLAIERRYVRPVFTDKAINIKASRHPVVEQSVQASFVANDIQLDGGGCLLLTGPNMAGKSTLMRQVALSVIMAQTGSYVPAESAQLPVFEQLFTRIGASDQLSEGLSTFMVEMTETAEILKNSGPKSLIVLDEIGRGTSTFDGMALAQALLEYVLEQVKATTLFATHYHELTELDKKYLQLSNSHMKVIEKNGSIHFMHTLMKGPALKSYGVQVGQLAGLPEAVTIRAQQLLKEKEQKAASQKSASPVQMSLL